MLNSKEALFKLAKELDYKPEILEKVYRLLNSLKQIMRVPYLKERLVLKGGTALNLFCFDKTPRLSVDIDLNYIGQIDRAKMIEERQIINDAIKQIFQQNQFELYRNPNHHAGGKMVWRYPSLLGQRGNIEIDLNYMYRRPLWSYADQKPILNFGEDFAIPVLDVHELAAGKLSALFTRQASRDLFDTHYLLTKCKMNKEKLRLSFVIYMSMAPITLSNLNKNKLQVTPAKTAEE
jgi:predicted nucleotidyltransferase component of viral defense system